MLRQVTFFRVFWVSKQCSRNFNVSNAWTNTRHKMMEEKTGVERQSSKKGFERMSMPAACSVEGVLVVSDLSARQYLNVAGQTWKIQSLSKLRQV